jgi:steroid delta-isomerase
MTREQIERRLEEYRAALRSMDPDRWVGMFAEDAEVQDPVGGQVHRGHGQVRAFFMEVRRRRKLLDMIPEASYITPPNGAAVMWSLRAVQRSGPDVTLKGISTYEFREDGKLTRMLVYWSSDPAWSREGDRP